MPHIDKLLVWLHKQDEVDVLELLNIHTADIIERFMDVIEERKDYLDTEYEEIPNVELFDEDEVEDEYDDFEVYDPDELDED